MVRKCLLGLVVGYLFSDKAVTALATIAAATKIGVCVCVCVCVCVPAIGLEDVIDHI